MSALAMLAVMLGTALLGMPLAYAVGLAGAVGVFLFGGLSPVIIAQRIYESLNSFPLVAIPLFLLMASLLDQAGISEALVRLSNALVGRVRGSLALGNVAASMFFAGISGSSLAETASIGSLLIPVMKRQGYDASFAGALTAAATMVGPIIPPSILMILYGAATNQSVIRLFLGGAVPGVLLSVVFGVTAYIMCWKGNYGQPYRATVREAARALVHSLPGLVVPVLIFAGVIGGLFTVTESSAVAALYALVLAGLVSFIRRERPWRAIARILHRACEDTATVAIMIGTSGLLAWALTISQVPQTIVEAMGLLSAGPAMTILFMNCFLLLLGMIMAPAPALLLATPLLVPLARSIGMDLIHLGVMIVFNLQIGTLTPPVANAAFVTARLAGISFEEQIRALIPWIGISIAVLVLVSYVPAITLWLPNLAFK